MPTCIEMEIYPHIEDKITKKFAANLERAFMKIADKYVSRPVYEREQEAVQARIADSSES